MHSKQNKVYYRTFSSSTGTTKSKRVPPADTRTKLLIGNHFKIRGTKKDSV